MLTTLPLICLTGPTAVGKSQLAIDLAEQLPCDIISVDSVMVYRGMDIGTAKPDQATLSRITHRLVNIRDPIDPYSAGEFFRDVQAIAKDSIKRERIPLLVGGTMLYFNTLRQGLADLPTHQHSAYPTLKAELDQLDSDALYQKLQDYDALTAQRLHRHDRQRIQRALMVYYLSKQPLSHLHQSAKRHFPYPMIWIAVYPKDRTTLRNNITRRFQLMLTQGFLEEVQQLCRKFQLSEDLPAYRAVGYRQAFDYLKAKSSYDTFITRSTDMTYQLAKHQLTWLKSWKELANFSVDDPFLCKKVTHYIQEKIKDYLA